MPVRYVVEDSKTFLEIWDGGKLWRKYEQADMTPVHWEHDGAGNLIVWGGPWLQDKPVKLERAKSIHATLAEQLPTAEWSRRPNLSWWVGQLSSAIEDAEYYRTHHPTTQEGSRHAAD